MTRQHTTAKYLTVNHSTQGLLHCADNATISPFIDIAHATSRFTRTGQPNTTHHCPRPMCQIRTISYICGHTCSFQLSKCGGNFSHFKQKSREERASCAGYAALTKYSKNQCGPCSKQTYERELDARMRSVSLSLPDHPEGVVDDGAAEAPEALTKAKQVREQELYLLNQRFPDGRFKRIARPEKGRARIKGGRRRSQLCVEVLPEDLMVKDDEGMTYSDGSWGGGWGDDSSAGGWHRLDDEIAEDQAAKEAAGITVYWGPWSGQREPEEDLYHAGQAGGAVESTESVACLSKASRKKRTFEHGHNDGSRVNETVDDDCEEREFFGTLDTMLSARD